MKTTLLLITMFFSYTLLASNDPVDLKIEIDKAVEVKSGNNSSQIQMWVSIICAGFTLIGATIASLVSRSTALKTIEKQSKKSFDLQNRQHALNVLRECIVNYLSIISKTILIPRNGKIIIPDENYSAIITAQTNLILMLDPGKVGNKELIDEIKILSSQSCSPNEASNAPDQYNKVQDLLRKLLKTKWDRIKGIQD